MNVSDILIRVKRAFGDESGVQVTDADIIRWINDGQRQIVMHNEGLLEKVSLADTVANQQEYGLPADCMMLQSVRYKGPSDPSFFRLRGYHLNEFNELIDGWDGSVYTQGTPTAFCVQAGKIELFPIPDYSLVGSIKIYYNRAPVDTTLLTDVPEIPVLYHEVLVKYCLAQAYELDEDWQASGIKAQDMAADLNLLRGKDDWKKQDTYPVITVLLDDRM